MPVQSKVRQYEENEVDFATLSDKAHEVLGKRPFRWQLEAAVAILSGKDVVLDVGTGCGKSLCFTLPLLLNDTDVGITVTPLTALMLDQAKNSRLPSVAVCQQTVAQVGKERLYKDIIDRKFRQVFISPEIATSKEFQREVLSKMEFTQHVRVVNIDEVHCVTLWGGTFRPEYAQLGLFRGRFPRNVPFQLASATLPDHILDDVKTNLRVTKNVKVIAVTNERPNIALSVRPMQHSDESKADLRFLIPQDAKDPSDIPITLIYCNKRKTTEECVDRMRGWAEELGIPQDCIAFYHAYVGEDRKRELEDLLSRDIMRAMFATEALGMGCDLRNVQRVVLWGLPPTFCGLVQRIGRAGRNLETDAEAIVIVQKSVLKDGVVEATVVEDSVQDQADVPDIPAVTTEEADGEIDSEGIRVQADNNEDDEQTHTDVVATAQKGKRRAAIFNSDTNIHETRALLEFVQTTSCRRIPWNDFFKNDKKLQLVQGVTTTYKSRENQRCCDNCQLSRFPVEHITTSRVEKGLKRGKKKKVPAEEAGYITKKLKQWREDVLMEAYYGGITAFSTSTVMGDHIIDSISHCGERVRDYNELRRHVRWANGHDTDKNAPNEYGALLMEELGKIYEALDAQDTRMKEQEEAKKREEERKRQEARQQNRDFRFINQTASDYN